MAIRWTVDEHPLLDVKAFVARWDGPLAQYAEEAGKLAACFADDVADAPLQTNEDVCAAVRDLLRWGGFKPTGRSKPASEYLVGAMREGRLSSINLLVDACNLVSRHSGLPISVVDLDLAHEPFRIGIAEPGSSYVFNVSGQLIDVGKLLCLFDVEGPCANAVKDAQRTKTRPETRHALIIIWGTRQLPGRAELASQWYQSLLTERGLAIESLT